MLGFHAGMNTKLLDSRPSSMAKFFSSASGQELGNTSSSEGEKDSPPPEWDSVPIHKAGSCEYLVYQFIIYFIILWTVKE